MFIAETTMLAPMDFKSRVVGNLVQSIVALKSTPYISTIARNINAKSMIGLLSADIKKNDKINIRTINTKDYEQAKSDLDFVVELINSSISEVNK